MKRIVSTIAIALLIMTASVALAGGEKCNKEGALTDADLAKITEKYKSKGWLGIETDKAGGGHYKVTRVLPGSPAENAGFQAGDILLALNDVKLSAENKEALKKAKMKLGPGSEVRYTVKRDGGKTTLAATLANPPEEVVAQWVDNYVKEHSKEDKVASK